MVELLDPGTEVETCLMAGRGLNGLRGVVVRRGPDGGRYTLELEDGEIMSVRIRNVRRLLPEPGEDARCIRDDDGVRPPGTTGSDEGVASDSPPPRAPSSASTAEGGDDERDVPQAGIQQRRTDSILDAVSPANAILAALVAYFYLKSERGDGARIDVPCEGMSTAATATLAAFSCLAWEWGTRPRRDRPRGEFRLSNLSGRLSRCDFWELLPLSLLAMWGLGVPPHAIGGVCTLAFFAWQFGTKNGRAPFGWDNAKARVANLNVWEALMFARILQGGVGALDRMGRQRRRFRRR